MGGSPDFCLSAVYRQGCWFSSSHYPYNYIHFCMHDPSQDLKISLCWGVLCSQILTLQPLLSSNKDIKSELQATSHCASGHSPLLWGRLSGRLARPCRAQPGGWVDGLAAFRELAKSKDSPQGAWTPSVLPSSA